MAKATSGGISRPSGPVDECTPVDCRTLMAKLDQRLDGMQRTSEDIAERVEVGNTRLAAFGERIAACEQNEKGIWHAIRASEMRLQSHLAECPGRAYAMQRISPRSARSSVSPDTADMEAASLITQQIRTLQREADEQRGGAFTVPRWLLYLAIGGGILIAVAAWAFGALSSGGLGALVGGAP